MKFVILDGFLVNFDKIGLSIDNHEQKWYPASDKDQIVERIGDADGVIINRAPITADVMSACPNLRYIGTFSTGYNMIDIDFATKCNITVCNVPGYSTAAVAQHTFGLLLEIVGRVGEFDRLVRDGDWNISGNRKIAAISTHELINKTLGIFGAGNIGTQVAKLGKAFGMHVLLYRRNPPMNSDLVFVDFDTLLARSDALSIHTPLTEETHGLFDAATISKMKNGAILLNTARGAILDEVAVAAALDSGKLYAAGLDVMTDEPPLRCNPLIGHPRTIITPHVAWKPRETRERLLELVASNILAFIEGHPNNVVNPRVVMN